jgi:GMP synthase (glutamine-hydrolysing)
MPDTENLEKILVLDFGAQYAHLICRRIRELGVYSELVPYDITEDEIRRKKAKGLILSGGPMSVYAKGAPLPRKEIYNLGMPVLGICYGLQAMVDQNGGTLYRGQKKEFGRASLDITKASGIFSGFTSQKTVCWMSHGDAAKSLPKGFEAIARTEDSPYAAIASGNRLFAVQFHPEVSHTVDGSKILSNFVFDVCGCSRNWSTETMIEDCMSEIASKVGRGENVLCALSGGIDSATSALLIEKTIGKEHLKCVFVDHGLLRQGERERIESFFRPRLGKNLIVVDDSKKFLSALRGVKDPEEKRIIVGREFIRSFERASRKMRSNFKWLAQGTLYTDIVESASGGASKKTRAKIKSHHNVAGIPSDLNFKLLEPLKDLYKDEVRRIASKLGLPKQLVETHPFPGPGLSVRIIGEVTKKKLEIVRSASAIVEEVLSQSGLSASIWQAYAFTGDDLATGVKGDARELGHIVTVRIVESKDGMTADWVRINSELLERISNRITNEVAGVTWVTYAISSKPPSTIEPQ